MRPSHWCVTLVTIIAFSDPFSAFAQGQIPPAGRPTGTPAGQPNGARPAGAPAAQPVAQPNVAHQNVAPGGTTVAVIDIKYIFENHIRFKEAMEDIKKDYEAFEAQVRTVAANQQKQIEQLKGMPAGSPEFKALEQQIATQRTQVQLDINNKQKERVEDEAQVYHRANQELVTAVQQFAARHGIDLVLQYSSAEIDPSKPDTVIRGLNRMVVYHNQLHITDEILKQLNHGVVPRQPDARIGQRPVNPSPPPVRPGLTSPGKATAPSGIPNNGAFPKTR